MKKCDCGCITIGKRDNHPPEYVCRCSKCSGHATGWLHDIHLKEVEAMQEIELFDKLMLKELYDMLKKEQSDDCECKKCKRVRKLINDLSEVKSE